MSASCSACTLTSESYSAVSLASSALRSRLAAALAAAARRRDSASAATWLRFPTARSFSRSVRAA